jgi:hypothetical protein
MSESTNHGGRQCRNRRRWNEGRGDWHAKDFDCVVDTFRDAKGKPRPDTNDVGNARRRREAAHVVSQSRVSLVRGSRCQHVSHSIYGPSRATSIVYEKCCVLDIICTFHPKSFMTDFTVSFPGINPPMCYAKKSPQNAEVVCKHHPIHHVYNKAKAHRSILQPQ